MAHRKKESPIPPPRAGILPNKLAPELTRATAQSHGAAVVEVAQGLGISIEDTVRFLAVARQCVGAREAAGSGV
jgi:hypothetical protein